MPTNPQVSTATTPGGIDFEGQQRADLLDETRETLERQQYIARNAVASRAALESFVQTQNELQEALDKALKELGE